MILIWLLVIPFAGGILAWMASRREPEGARWISLTALVVELFVVVYAWATAADGAGPWLLECRLQWIPSLGADFWLAMDGIGFVMVMLTAFLGIASVVCSWTEIRERIGFFHFNLMASLTGIVGVFLAMDLLLFYFFWEAMLIPMYFLIGVWGHERRIYAAVKFFIFTQAGGLLMLAAIIALYLVHGSLAEGYTFGYTALLDTTMDPRIGFWLMLGFFVAFAVKLPAFPFHTWLPDAHTQAPTAGSVILAGLLLKTGAYGLLRFAVPLFPDVASAYGWFAMLLGVIGIVYGAVMAFGQEDFKRMVAYTSVSHMGFVLLGVGAWNETALQGVMVQIVCHGISTGALFIIVGMLQERTGTRELSRFGGLWPQAPRMGGVTLVFALASLGLPGLGNFVGEFLILIGSYKTAPVLTIIAAGGLVLAAAYSLRMMQRVFFGPAESPFTITDLKPREMGMMAVLIAAIVWLGVYPQTLLKTSESAVRRAVFGMQAETVMSAEDTRSHIASRIVPGVPLGRDDSREDTP